MKKVYLILLWIWLAFTAMAQQSLVFQGTYNSGQHTIYHSSLVTDTVNPTAVSQDAKVELRAATSIRLLPGFRAGGFTPGNGGYFLARLGLGGSRKDTAICKGQQIQLGDSAELNVSYAWSPSIGLNDTTLSNPLANPDSTTMYLLLKTYPNGRVEIDTVVVVVNALPVADAGSDVAVCAGGSVGLNASASGGTPSYTYAWSPSTGLGSSSVANPTASPSATTTYTVTVTDSKGCSANDGVVVTVNQLGDACNCIIQADSLDSIGSKYTILLDSEITWFAITAIDSSFMLEIQTDDSALINNIEIFENCDGDSIPQEYYRRFTDNYLIIKDAIPAQTYFVKFTVLNLIEAKLAKISLKSAPANPSNTLSNGLFQISDCEWFRKSGTTGSDIGSDIAIDPATGNSFGVYTYKFNGTNVWILIAYDPDGNILWFKYPQPCANLSLVNSSSAAVSFDIYNNRVVVAGDFTGTMNLGNNCLNSNLGSVFVASFAASSGTLSNSANYGVNFTPQILGNYSPEDAIMPYLVTSPCVFIDSDIYGNSFMAISTKNIDASFSFFVTPNLQLTPSIAALNSSNVDFYPDVAILKLNSNLSLVWQNSIGGQGLHDCNGISYNQTSEKIYVMGIFEKGLLPNGADNFIDYSNSPFTNSNTRKISAYIAPFDARTASTTGDFNSLGFRRIAPYGINDEAGQTLGVFLTDINSNNNRTVVVGKTIHDSQSLQKYQAYDISGATITPSNLGGAIPWYENFVYSVTDDQCIKIEHNLTSNSGFLPSGIAINNNDEIFVNGYLSGSVDIGTSSGASFIINPHNLTYGSPAIIKKNLSGATLGSVTFGAYGTFITPIRSKIEVDDCSTFSVGNLEYSSDVFQNNYTAAATDHYTLKYNVQLVNTDTQYVCLTSGNITLTSPLIGNSYSWNPGGATSSSISVSSSGIYTLSVTTSCCTYQIVFIVVQGPPTGTINANQNCSTGQFSFNFAGNNYPNSYSWDFGDPSTTTDVSTLPNPTYTYPTTGVYDVTLIIANACTSATFQLQVYVLDACCFQSNRFVFSNISASNLNSLFPTLLSAISPITITAKNIYIDGQFTVDQPIIFNSCDILMGENAQIILTSAGSALDMELNGTQVKGCDKMWDFMEANNSNEQIKINGTSIIEDGKQAVKCINGGKFDINGAYFNKNYTSIFIDNGGSNPGSVTNSGFFCHQSLLNPTDAFLLPPYQTTESKSHIEISNTTSITIGNTTSHNIFNNATFGIFADNVSSLSVIHNKFYDMNAGYNQTGPIGGGQLVYTGNGICAVGSGSNDFLNVSDENEFYNCDLGVKIQNGIFLNVDDNYFENCKLYGVGFGFNFGNFNVDINNNTFGAKDEQPVGWAVGGWLSSGNTININDNVIDFSDAAENTGRGIILSESGFNMNYPGSNFNIISNKMNSVVTGIQLLGQNGINSPLVNEDPSIGSLDWELSAATDLVKDNNILLRSTTSLLSNLYNDGIVAKNCTGIAITCNDVSCDGGLSCNDWKWWSQGVSHDGGGASVIKTNKVSNLSIGLGFGQDLRPTELVLDNQMINLGRTGMFFGWGAIGNQGSLLSSSPTTIGYSYGNKWLGTNWSGTGPFHSEAYGAGTQGNLSKFFVKNAAPYIPTINIQTNSAPSNMQYQTLDNTIFYTSCALPELLGFEAGNPDNIVLQNCLLVINDTSTATDDISETNRFWSKFNTYSFLKTDTNGIMEMDSLLINFMANNATSDIGKLYAVQNTISRGRNVKQTELDSLAALNATISGAVLATANLKAINALLLSKPESLDYNSAEKSFIREMAALCPYTDGPAVYIARGLAKGIDSTITDYINECELIPEPSSLRREEPSQVSSNDNTVSRIVTIYPNPNSGEFNFQYNLEEGEIGTLSIYSVIGSKVFDQSNFMGNGKQNITVSNLSNGFYSIRFTSNNRALDWKLSISKDN